MNPPVIHAVFPWPVYTALLERDLSDNEIAFAYECGDGYETNVGGLISKDRRVLDAPRMKELRAMIDAHIDLYVSRVIAPREQIGIYITQSWFNMLKLGMHHHQHTHANSIISGVVYFKVQPGDAINFYRHDHRHMFMVPSVASNSYNSDVVTVPVEAGEIVLFPSSLTHGVDPVGYNREEGRLSLSFNTFLFGKVGDDASSSGLAIV